MPALRCVLFPVLPVAEIIGISAEPYNTFDGEGFPACNNVTTVHNATSVNDIVSLVKRAAANGTPVRASGNGHMWYDTMCSDNLDTVIIRTEFVNRISNLVLEEGAKSRTVEIEAGVTFLQFAEYLHANNASMGYTLVNWNITMAGAVAMGGHRSAIREDSMVAAGVLSLDIVNGDGESSPSLLQGAFTCNTSQWWPYLRKFHWRYYDKVPLDLSNQEGFQNTFSTTDFQAFTAKAILEDRKYLMTSNMLFEATAFALWSSPNFREKKTQKAINQWPVYGWNYDVLIGGPYPDQKPEWEYGMHGATLELAFPVVLANKMLKRVRQAFDEEAAEGIIMTSTYRSGINIKFGRAYYDFLGQVTYNTSDGADWSKGAIMFDFPSFKPTIGDGKRFNEDFYRRLAKTLIDEFPARPHWTKNTRAVFANATKNIDPSHLAQFRAVREKFDPWGTFKSIVGEILGLYN
ncbi:FAD-binding domain-containing protein [Durotheca rogersii]|uniref:FAD-binding domain-containing protein n=1 Tax=Durotheca rogersii TaxID=419775 RepID=UPI00221F2871|nr:FAD-binding domain-containing protein [Durotheca rogersii]KAI5867667.1 FAD-binding domain-containing protein [Durotheca rogersii]